MKTVMAATAAVVACAVGNSALAGIAVEVYGTAPPPSTVAGRPITPAQPDLSPLFSSVSSIALSSTVSLGFSTPAEHRKIGMGWALWSHGYTGDVYYAPGATSITIVPNMVDAFVLYMQPEPFSIFSMTVTGSDGMSTVSTVQTVDGLGGAVGVGFYGTGGMCISSITVSSSVDFAIGEFWFSECVPSPGTAGLLGIAALVRRRPGRC